MITGIRTVIYPVNDIARAKLFFAVLTGAEPVVDAPYYVQFDAEGQNIGLAPHGHRFGQNGPVAYWHVNNIAKNLTALVEAGTKNEQKPTNKKNKKKNTDTKDTDNNQNGQRPGA